MAVWKAKPQFINGVDPTPFTWRIEEYEGSTCPKRPQPSATHKFQETWFVNGSGEIEDGVAG